MGAGYLLRNSLRNHTASIVVAIFGAVVVMLFSFSGSSYASWVVTSPITIGSNSTMVWQDGAVLSTGVSGASCSTTGSSDTSTGTTGILTLPATNSAACRWLYFEFNIDQLPDDATITRADLNFEVTAVSNPVNCDFTSVNGGTVRDNTPGNIYTDIGNGTIYVSNSSACASTGDKTVTLGSSANSELQNSLQSTKTGLNNHWFGVGIKNNVQNRDSTLHTSTIGFTEHVTSANRPNLIVYFTQNAVTSVVLDSASITEDGNIATTSAAGTSCPSPSNSKSTGTTAQDARIDGSGGGICVRNYEEFSLSFLPAPVGNVTELIFQDRVGKNSTPRACDMFQLSTQPSSTSSGATVWSDIGDGHQYFSASSYCTSLTAAPVPRDWVMPDSAKSDFLSGNNWFAFGFKLTNETRASNQFDVYFSPSETGVGQKPRLIVKYCQCAASSADSKLQSSGEQRVTYFDGTRNWLFYYDGSNLVYKHSENSGGLWSYSASAQTGPLASNSFYTVYGEGANIMIAYSSTSAVLTKSGTISGTSITWASNPQTVLTVSGTNAGQKLYPSFEKIGSSYFLAYNVMNGGANAAYVNSTSSIGGSWSASAQLYSNQAQPAPVGLAKYATTKALAVYALYDQDEFKYRIFNGGWGGESSTSCADLNANSSKTNSFSTTSDGQNAWIAYTPSNSGGSLKVLRFSDSGGFTISCRTAITGTNYEPAISSQSGSVGILYLHGNNITATSVINGDVDDWHVKTLPFGYAFNNVHYPHIEKETSTSVNAGAWSEGGSSQFVKSRNTDFRDSDGDSLYDSWETNGIDYDMNGQVDLTLAGANPLHKDLYLEIDYMQYHDPMASARAHVVQAFASAPVANPDNSTGINLHILLDEQLDHVASVSESDVWDYFRTVKASHFGLSADRTSPNAVNILSARAYLYYYNIWMHSVPGVQLFTNVLGEAEAIPGNDFYVALGPLAYNSTLDHNVGTLDEQEGSLMHEFGHTLGLGHGGDQLTINCKPNYLSVMNYALVYKANVVANRPLDFSRSAIASLNESSLNEADGVGQSTPANLTTAYGEAGVDVVYTSQVGQPFDWNHNTIFTETGVNENINHIYANVTGSCGESSADEYMTGFDDWSALTLSWENGIAGYGSVLQNGTSYDETFTDQMVQEFHQSKLRGIDNLLQNIDNSSFRANVTSSHAKAMFHQMLFTGDNNPSQAIKSQQFDRVVQVLKELRSKMDGARGGNAEDDLIVDPDAQKLVLEQLDNVIETFRIASGDHAKGSK